MDCLFGRHNSFLLFMTISFETVHTCVYIQNTNTHEALISQNKIFYEVFTAIHKHFTFDTHICSQCNV